jgi:transcriptional regulator with XRE-family HTH domain
MATEYGKRLRSARKEAGLTQVGLSELTGIPQSTISTAEREGHGSSDTSTYALFCGVNPHWLATGEGDRKAAVKSGSAAADRDFVRERLSAEAVLLGRRLDKIQDDDIKGEALAMCLQVVQSHFRRWKDGSPDDDGISPPKPDPHTRRHPPVPSTKK